MYFITRIALDCSLKSVLSMRHSFFVIFPRRYFYFRRKIAFLPVISRLQFAYQEWKRPKASLPNLLFHHVNTHIHVYTSKYPMPAHKLVPWFKAKQRSPELDSEALSGTRPGILCEDSLTKSGVERKEKRPVHGGECQQNQKNCPVTPCLELPPSTLPMSLLSVLFPLVGVPNHEHHALPTPNSLLLP